MRWWWNDERWRRRGGGGEETANRFIIRATDAASALSHARKQSKIWFDKIHSSVAPNIERIVFCEFVTIWQHLFQIVTNLLEDPSLSFFVCGFQVSTRFSLKINNKFSF